jgi:hypothetical protein
MSLTLFTQKSKILISWRAEINITGGIKVWGVGCSVGFGRPLPGTSPVLHLSLPFVKVYSHFFTLLNQIVG